MMTSERWIEKHGNELGYDRYVKNFKFNKSFHNALKQIKDEGYLTEGELKRLRAVKKCTH